MEISFAKRGEWTVVTVQGRIDTISAPDFEKSMREQMTQGSNRFLVDLAKCDYISSAGLRCILAAGKNAKASGGELACCGLSGMVKQVFDISGFRSLLRIFDSPDDAAKE
ncbi:MAG: STAS domain-containing protein [Desulfomonile tiedjei]|nr:STAS domain-containing protein [Desulfomonile tiedjei]